MKHIETNKLTPTNWHGFQDNTKSIERKFKRKSSGECQGFGTRMKRWNNRERIFIYTKLLRIFSFPVVSKICNYKLVEVIFRV